ncbi:MAG: hypothetical protein ABIG29_01080 [Candidatus Nealsonbacteria bacterium]
MYHGSGKRFSKLIRQKAHAVPEAPENEKLNMIYLTPDYSFALAMAARPMGFSGVDHKRRIVHYNLDNFEPEKEVYVYVIDISKIPEDKIIKIDELQVAVDIDEIVPVEVQKHKAGEVSQYYSIQGGEW